MVASVGWRNGVAFGERMAFFQNEGSTTNQTGSGSRGLAWASQYTRLNRGLPYVDGMSSSCDSYYMYIPGLGHVCNGLTKLQFRTTMVDGPDRDAQKGYCYEGASLPSTIYAPPLYCGDGVCSKDEATGPGPGDLYWGPETMNNCPEDCKYEDSCRELPDGLQYLDADGTGVEREYPALCENGFTKALSYPQSFAESGGGGFYGEWVSGALVNERHPESEMYRGKSYNGVAMNQIMIRTSHGRLVIDLRESVGPDGVRGQILDGSPDRRITLPGLFSSWNGGELDVSASVSTAEVWTVFAPASLPYIEIPASSRPTLNSFQHNVTNQGRARFSALALVRSREHPAVAAEAYAGFGHFMWPAFGGWAIGAQQAGVWPPEPDIMDVTEPSNLEIWVK